MGSLVSTNDFQQIINDFGRVVSYKVCTKTTDSITGQETTTYATATNVTAVYFLEDQRYIWDKEGLLQVGDAYLILPYSASPKRYDQVIIDGITYYVDNIVARVVLTTGMQQYLTLFKVT